MLRPILWDRASQSPKTLASNSYQPPDATSRSGHYGKANPTNTKCRAIECRSCHLAQTEFKFQALVEAARRRFLRVLRSLTSSVGHVDGHPKTRMLSRRWSLMPAFAASSHESRSIVSEEDTKHPSPGVPVISTILKGRRLRRARNLGSPLNSEFRVDLLRRFQRDALLVPVREIGHVSGDSRAITDLDRGIW